MAMYHSWDSQNAWLRQIHAHNHLYVNPAVARAAGIEDGGWIWVESPWGKVRCLASYSERSSPAPSGRGTQSARRGRVEPCDDANESQRGFLLNHLISDELRGDDGMRISNSDPVTGQAAGTTSACGSTRRKRTSRKRRGRNSRQWRPLRECGKAPAVAGVLRRPR
jgi:anaerobic selenocysteine-containing dehydrogenase